MQTKAVTALYDYWTRQRGQDAVPFRHAIAPADIAAILPDVFMLEQGRRSDPRFRLAGTRLCAAFGGELKNMTFDGLFAADQRARIARVASNVMAHAAPAVLQVEMIDMAGERSEGEIILLPLATKGRIADRIIGAFAPLPGQRRPLAAYRQAELVGLSAIDPQRSDAQVPSRPAVPLPTAVMAIRPSGIGETVSRVLHLRIFEGGGRRAGGKTIGFRDRPASADPM